MTNEQAKIAVLKKCKDDLLFFGKTITPKAFFYKSPAFHRPMTDLMMDRSKEQVCIQAPRGFAKAQSLNSKVLTPNGWLRFGDINVGDEVIGRDGKPTQVIATHPISEMDLYRVTTRDGRSTLCNKEHLWSVYIPQNTKNHELTTRTTEELLEIYKKPKLDKRTGKTHIEYKVYLPTPDPIQFAEKDFLIDPYTLGAWLGDGNSTGGRFTTADPEILGYFPYEVTSHESEYNYGILGLHVQLRELGLLNNKHIPEEYFLGSVSQREALLQGLIDTDGSILKTGQNISFCQKNERLLNDVIDLVRSLGGTATKSEQWTSFDKDSELKHSYRLSIRLPKEITPSKLKRKADRWIGSIKTKSAITEIEYVCTGLGRCITVENEDGLYVTDDYMVTHNSTMGVFMILHHILFDEGDKVVIIQSKTQSEAINRLTKIKNVLEYSIPFRELFGYGGEGVADSWTEKKIKSSIGRTSFSIRAVGTGMPVRGALETSKSLEDTRITLYYLDDPDDEDNTLTKEQMIKNYDKFAGGKEGLDTRTGRVIVVGTPIREGCIVEKIHGTSGWHSQLYQAIDEEGNLLWAEMRDHAWLKAKKEEFREQGRISKFYSEYMCQIVGDEDQLFKEEYLKYYDGYIKHNEDDAYLYITHIGTGKNKVELEEEIIKPVHIFLGIDPASSTKQTADYSVTFPIAYDGRDIYVLPYFRERVTPTFHADQIVETIENLKPIRGHVETTGYQEMLRDYLRERMYQKDAYLSGLEKKFSSRTEKSVRLETLHPLFYNRRVHVKDDMTAFIDELLIYPRGRNDDTLDGFYYATRKLLPPSHTVEDSKPRQLNDYELFMLQNSNNEKTWLAS